MLLGLLNCFFVFSSAMGSASFLPPLSPEEENRYLEEFAAGSAEAKNVLIERNLRLVAHIVKKYSQTIKDTEDLISIGTIGLIKAIHTFNHTKGTRLATYASRCIDNEILMHLRSTKKHSQEISLSDPVGTDKDGNEITVEDKLAEQGHGVEEEVGLKLQIVQLYQCIDKLLKGKERFIVEMRYGLFNNRVFTQREIADMLSISRSYVSRIEKKAVDKLRKAFEN